jgi:hypothetical protein
MKWLLDRANWKRERDERKRARAKSDLVSHLARLHGEAIGKAVILAQSTEGSTWDAATFMQFLAEIVLPTREMTTKSPSVHDTARMLAIGLRHCAESARGTLSLQSVPAEFAERGVDLNDYQESALSALFSVLSGICGWVQNVKRGGDRLLIGDDDEVLSAAHDRLVLDALTGNQTLLDSIQDAMGAGEGIPAGFSLFFPPNSEYTSFPDLRGTWVSLLRGVRKIVAQG